MGTLHELPRMIISDKNVVQIATGEKQCVARTADGRVLSAGISGMGRLDSQVTLGEQHSFLEMNNDSYMKSRQDGMMPSFLTTCCNHTCVIFAASSCIDEVSKFSVEVAQDRGPIEKSSLSLLEVNIRLTAAHRALLHSQSSLDVRHVLNRASFENVIDRVNTLICEMESITVPTPTPELASGGKAAKRRRAASSSKDKSGKKKKVAASQKNPKKKEKKKKNADLQKPPTKATSKKKGAAQAPAVKKVIKKKTFLKKESAAAAKRT